MAEIAAMRMVETGGAPSEATVPQIFTVAAWNIERCLFPEKSAALLAAQTPDVVLLSEVDCGMARTAQRHPTAEIAAALGMHYAYGVEFFELGLGGETERPFCVDDHNEAGWHGNAVLSRAAPIATTLIRLDDHGHWYIDGPFSWDRDQPRIGGRMAIATIIPTVAGNLCVVSVHLESNADSAHRGRQMERLIEAIDSFAPDLPVIIGGDLNTGNSKDAPDWRDESLFDIARENGYSWDNNADGMTTRRSFLTPHPTRSMKLDWFAARGLSMDGAAIVPALDPAGEPLSDHELIVGHFAIP
ncbi:MAG: endonuclease/exonuclease/phosphatase family protein [Hoeflea sp.]|nr:endonuclease/exonuclease/phosphatase family protein [Alphaproteobacteria bacterium]MBV1724085.1 endonuclease/exonuclease/phosphatase family protein [Hoeflea sp.]MBU4546469.1 endonuclease/exonuclease/phosphatase family protein [Alphaproteobacteria bacterium]MBU4553013.1 endonuclease/exonuclease/phosphatase family protein [Alphaproteobacteria bacterium]MBV1759770.1 endonuclease/exonuclease/phosphatase family protein [Hoeflea sp.]